MRSAVREVTVDGDLTTVDAAIRDGLAALGARLSATGPAARIEARTGASARTFGEVISVDLVPNAGGRTHVRVHVRTAVRATLLDYGRTAKVARYLVRAASDPAWAEHVASEVGRPVASSVWLAVPVGVAGVAAGLALLPAAGERRTALVVAAGVAALLWVLAVASRSITVRRRGRYVPPWQSMVMLAGTLVLFFGVSGALQPRHAAVVLSGSADLSSFVGSLAAAALIATAVRRVRKRSTAR